MKAKMFLIVATLSLIVSLTFFAYAYLKDTKNTDDLIYEVGNFKISASGSIINTYLVPGINIVEDEYNITNLSNFNIEVRIKITIKLDGETIVFDDEAESDSNFIEKLNLKFSDEEETLFVESEEKAGYLNYTKELAPNQTLVLFDELILDGWHVQSQYSGKNLQVIVNIDAKQARHATWEDIN